MIERVIFRGGPRDGEVLENNGNKESIPDVIMGSSQFFFEHGTAYLLMYTDLDKAIALYEPIEVWYANSAAEEIGPG